MNAQIHSSWRELFDEFDIDLDSFDRRGPYYPPRDQVFRVFEMPVDRIRVVLLGQDPYHGPGQAHGLSFSVDKGTRVPPSLQNIFRELKAEFPEREYAFTTGDLSKWSENGIFLLNSALTVAPGTPLSHINLWAEFTDRTIEWIAQTNPRCVFLLLGNFAKSKAALVKDSKRCILGVHPSPLARGFIGSGVFQKVEAALVEKVDWSN